MHISWEDASIGRTEGLDDRGIIAAIDDGARIIQLECVVSLLFYGFDTRRKFLIRPGESAASVGWLATMVTALFGWWGLGLLATPVALWRNLRGGVDVTDLMRAHIGARIVEQQAQARAQAELQAAAAATSATGSLDERRAAALVFLEQRNVDTAWALVGRDVLDGPLRRDFPLVRKLLVTASDQRGQEARAGLLATIILQDHPNEATNYIGHLVRKALRDADVPPGTIPQVPFLQTGRGLLTLLLGLAALAAVGAVALNEWLRLHRDLHVVNGTQDPVVVTVGATVLRLPSGGRGVAVVEEGTVSLSVERRGAARRVAVEVHVGFLDRFRPTAAIFNVEGAAVLLEEQRSWGDRAPALEPDRTHFGEELLVLPGVAPFTTFPAQKRLKRGESSVETHVVLRDGHPADLVHQLDGASLTQTLDYLELHARLAPEDGRLLDVYATLALSQGVERPREFLEQGLGPDPAGAWLLAWGRARNRAGDDDDALLAALRALPGEPNAARLALEARLEPDGRKARALIRRACTQDAAHPREPLPTLCRGELGLPSREPLLALVQAEEALRRGEVEAARRALDQAPEGRARQAAGLLLARVGSEWLAAQELQELDGQLHRQRFLVDVEALLELRATLGGEKGADAAVGPLLLQVGDDDDAKGWRLRVRLARAMALGVVKELRALGAEGGAAYPVLMAALLEGDPAASAEAAAAVGGDPYLADDLTLALALALVKGEASAAARLRPIVSSAWTAAGARGAPALEALAGSDPGPALDRLNLWPTACYAVRLAVAAGLPAGPARERLLTPVLPPRGPGYPCAVIRSLREALSEPDAGPR